MTYVECDPGGEDGNPLRCNAKGIEVYPTWEVEGQFVTGVLSLDELAQMTGFTFSGS